MYLKYIAIIFFVYYSFFNVLNKLFFFLQITQTRCYPSHSLMTMTTLSHEGATAERDGRTIHISTHNIMQRSASVHTDSVIMRGLQMMWTKIACVIYGHMDTIRNLEHFNQDQFIVHVLNYLFASNEPVSRECRLYLLVTGVCFWLIASREVGMQGCQQIRISLYYLVNSNDIPQIRFDRWWVILDRFVVLHRNILTMHLDDVWKSFKNSSWYIVVL